MSLVYCLIAVNTGVAQIAAPNAYQANVLSNDIIKPAFQYIVWPEEAPNLTNTDLNKAAWSAPQYDPINLGFTTTTAWLRIPLKSPEAATEQREYILYIEYPLLDELDFYHIQNNTIVSQKQTGDMRPFNQRPIKHRAFAIPFTAQPGELSFIYLQVKATDTLQVPVAIYPQAIFDYRRTKEQYIYGAYYGCMTIMIVFLSLLYFVLRDKTLLYYTAFTCSALLLSSSLNGDLYHLLYNTHPITIKWLRVFMLIIGSICMTAFARDFLNTKETHPKLYTVLNNIIKITFLVGCPLPFLAFFHAIQLTLFWSVLVSLASLTVGLISLKDKYPPATYYMIGWCTFLFGCFAKASSAFSLIETNFITEYGVQIGVLFNVVTISLGISHRFTVERRKLFSLQQATSEERHKKERAQAEVKAKSEFLANMSHEIRTPMNGVLGIANLLKDTPLSTQQEQYVKTIENSGQSLLRVINDILDFSKMEAGKMAIESIVFNVDELVSEASSLFSPIADEKELEFNVICKSNIPSFIYSDPVRIRQILLNLLSNAFKFTEAGFINIEYELIEENNEALIKFSVCDSGIGLTEEQSNSLFQSFVQADSSTTRQFGGTGLGLSISKKLSELLGGHVDVDSKIDKGSTFWFTVRANIHKMPPKTAIEFKQRYTSLFKNETILITAPDTKTLASLQLRFAQWGCSCKTYTSNRKLLEHYPNDNEPRSIILDYDELHASPALMEEVLAKLSTKTIPIIFSASAMIKPNIDEEQFAQPIRIIEKPLSFYRVYTTIEDCINDQITQQEQAAKQIDLSRLHVVVTEDNKVNQMVIKGMLKRLGITATLCDNGQECVDHINSNDEIDCIIMDCEMPVMDGYVATSNIRQMPDLKQPIIIGLSANALKEHEEKALAHGMNIYLRKPVDYEQLKTTLTNYFH